MAPAVVGRGQACHCWGEGLPISATASTPWGPPPTLPPSPLPLRSGEMCARRAACRRCVLVQCRDVHMRPGLLRVT